MKSRSGTKNHLRYRMLELGMTQKAFAERVGVDPSAVSRLLKGKREASMSTIAKMAEVLNIRIDTLFAWLGVTQDPEPIQTSFRRHSSKRSAVQVDQEKGDGEIQITLTLRRGEVAEVSGQDPRITESLKRRLMWNPSALVNALLQHTLLLEKVLTEGLPPIGRTPEQRGAAIRWHDEAYMRVATARKMLMEGAAMLPDGRPSYMKHFE